MGDVRRGRVEQLVRLAVGGKLEGKMDSGGDIHTERDLMGGEEFGGQTEKKSSSDSNLLKDAEGSFSRRQ